MMNVFITLLKVFKFFSSTLLRLGSGQCSAGEYQCAVGSTCVPAAQLCDGVPHCSDGSDEDWHAACPTVSSAAGLCRPSCS